MSTVHIGDKSYAHPDFQTLEALSGHPEMRYVDGSWMGDEEYDTCQWHVIREEATDDGKPYRYWGATLSGLQAYGRLIAERRGQRIAIARTVRERDDEFRDYVDSLDDAKARYGK